MGFFGGLFTQNQLRVFKRRQCYFHRHRHARSIVYRIMAHQIYLTDGIILKKRDFGEADRLFWIYTEKFGMIMASAKGVRLEKSKLRGNLDVFTCGDFAVISSKDFWRLVDARETISLKFNHNSAEQPSLIGGQVKVFARTASLLARMIKGEERNEEMWKQLKILFLNLFKKNVEKKDLKDLEIKSTAAILKTLGYMDEIPTSMPGLVSAINRAIKESML